MKRELRCTPARILYALADVLIAHGDDGVVETMDDALAMDDAFQAGVHAGIDFAFLPPREMRTVGRVA